MELQPQDWIEHVVHGVRSASSTIVEIFDPSRRWPLLQALLAATTTVWLIVPDRELEEALRALPEHLPGAAASEPRVAIIPESRFFEIVAERWLGHVLETLPNTMVVVKGDGFVERTRAALTRTVRDRALVRLLLRRMRLGRLPGSTAVVPEELVHELLPFQTVPIVNTSPDWVPYVQQDLGGPVLRSAPVDVGPMLAKTFEDRGLVLLSECLAVGRSMAFAANELGLDDPLVVFDELDRWDDVTLFTPPMPETSSSQWSYAVADATWQAVSSREGRSLVFADPFNVHAVERKIRRPLRVLGEKGSGVTLATPAQLDRLGTFPLMVVDRLPFPSSLDPVDHVKRARQIRWYEQCALPKAVQRFRRMLRCVEPGGTMVVLDRRIHSRTFGEWFLDEHHGVHLWDWGGFLPGDGGLASGGAR